jgi:hypothetical protein
MDVEHGELLAAVINGIMPTALSKEEDDIKKRGKNRLTKNAEEVERILVDWFSGNTPSGLQFDVAEQGDLDRLIAYMKALRPGTVKSVLPQLLSSPYLRSLRPPRRIAGCVPTIHFRAIKSPYVAGYRELVEQYGLQEFVAEAVQPEQGTVREFKFDTYAKGAGNDIYMCFIKFRDVYVVNLLPALGIQC